MLQNKLCHKSHISEEFILNDGRKALFDYPVKSILFCDAPVKIRVDFLQYKLKIKNHSLYILLFSLRFEHVSNDET